jgi:hypothetical protein
MTQQHKTVGFDLPHVDEEDKLRRVLSSALEARLGKNWNTRTEDNQESPLPYWGSSHFSLQNVKIYQDATGEEQREILQLCNNGLIEEAYFIEKAGVGYMSKMLTLAETTEERMLYALFSADEVTHLAQISRFLPHGDLVGTDDVFLRFLADVVETPNKAVLLFVLQVVLEGWGLSHYRSLAKDCLNPALASMFQGFLQEESRHHGTGVTLFDRIPLTKSSEQVIVETLALFLQMVQVGPVSVVTAIEKVKGDLSHPQKVQIFQELDAEHHSGTRLNLLRSLMHHSNAGGILQELETKGVFQPFAAEKCGLVTSH